MSEWGCAFALESVKLKIRVGPDETVADRSEADAADAVILPVEWELRYVCGQGFGMLHRCNCETMISIDENSGRTDTEGWQKHDLSKSY
jgi:hypothetical protein